MAATFKKVLIYEQDHQTASHIEFSARQFDLVPVKASRCEQAQRLIDEAAVDIAFTSSSLPELSLPRQVSVVPVIDDSTNKGDLLSAHPSMRVLYKPTSIFEVMAILKSILDPGVALRADYAFHMLRSKMMLRTLKFLLSTSLNERLGRFNLKESLYQFCVGQCPRAVTAEAADGTGQGKYKL